MTEDDDDTLVVIVALPGTDFGLYCKAVVNHIHAHREDYPAFAALVDKSLGRGNEHIVQMLTAGLGIVCYRHFNKNHVVTIPAAELEQAAVQGAVLAAALKDFGGGNGNVH